MPTLFSDRPYGPARKNGRQVSWRRQSVDNRTMGDSPMMRGQMYEVICDPDNPHFMVRSSSMDEAAQAAQDHVKRIHGQDVSIDDARKLVREVDASDMRM